MREANQKERLSKLKQGEGYFVYEGGAFDTEATPGVPLIGPDGNQVVTVPLIEVEQEDGSKITIADPKMKGKGKAVWKKAPKFTRTEMPAYRMRIHGVHAEHVEEETVLDPLTNKQKTVKKPSLTAAEGLDGKVKPLWLEFPKGKPVFVGDPRMALKCRCLAFFREVDGEAKSGPKSEKPKSEKPAA